MTIMVASKSPRRRAKPRAAESGARADDAGVVGTVGGTFLEVPVRRVETPARLAVYHFPEGSQLSEKWAKIH
jgi:hypothetical protein